MDANDIFTDFTKRVGELASDASYNGITFKQYTENEDIQKIIKKFKYSEGDNSSVVESGDESGDESLINAFFANDLYKLSMAPIVNQVSKHKQGCIVQFRIDLRTDSTFNETLKNEYVLNTDPKFVDDLVAKLDELKKRVFDEDMLNSVTSTRGGGAWKQYWQEKDKAFPIQGRTLIETNPAVIKANYKKDDGTAIEDTDFHANTVVLKCIPVPNDPKTQSTVVLSVVGRDPSKEGSKPDIRATGYWPLCSWLETPLMQTAYEVMHTWFLKKNSKSYGAWMAEALYRTFSGMVFLNKNENNSIKVALFSGRRTGGALFNLLQIWLWNKFDRPSIDGGRNLGTSSFWALETLKKLGLECSILPSGTHAHELSMTLNVLYPELDVTDKGFVGSQILGHLLYKKLSAGTTPTPMLTDTVGTRNFLATAVALKDGQNPALCSFSAARQDSGKLPDYKKIMDHYVGKAGCSSKPALMASEIDDRDKDFKTAIESGYVLAGVGGALGDSEKIETNITLGHDEFDKKTDFAASEAAKIARVWSGDEKSGYTLKTGDGDGKVTIDDKAPDSVVTDLKSRAAKLQKLHSDAVAALNGSVGPEELDLTFEEIADKQQLLDKLLNEITSAVSQSGGGRRRTRRKAHKYTKKNVRKNIRKSKNKKNRRASYRKSRK